MMETDGAEIQFARNDPRRWLRHTVLLAVSGGADSMALLTLFHQFYQNCAFTNEPLGRLLAAHANHQLRGEESDADERLVREHCERLGIPLVTRRLEIVRTADGLEQNAREARYAFLYQTACEQGARYVAVAHHADDQTETILHRILRGTGLDGLGGMARSRPLGDGVTLIRPLLEIPRATLRTFLSANHVPFREDSSNRNTHLTRNRIRQKILPFLREQMGSQIDESLFRLGQLASETQRFLDRLTETQYDAFVTRLSDGFQVHVALLREADPFLAGQILRRLWRQAGFPEQSMGKAQWDVLLRALRRGTATTFPGGVQVTSEGQIRIGGKTGEAP